MNAQLTFGDRLDHVAQANVFGINRYRASIVPDLLALNRRSNPKPVLVDVNAGDQSVRRDGRFEHPSAIGPFPNQLLVEHVGVVESGLDGDELKAV
jgi:hypothetical protein